jgi:LEA14-like dessication related protein
MIFMKIKFWLLVGALLLLLGCQDIKSPEVNVISVTPSFKTLSEMQADTLISVKNSNPFDLKGTVDYQLFLFDKEVSNGVVKDLLVKSKSQEQVNVPLQINLINTFGSIANAVQVVVGSQDTIPYQVKGTYQSNVAGIIPFKQPYEAKGEINIKPLKDKIKQELGDQLKNQIKGLF